MLKVVWWERGLGGARAIPSARTDSHYLSMEPCHYLSKEGLRTTSEGSGAPRGQPPLDRGLSPPPSHGRQWARQDHCSMEFCPSWVYLMGVSLVPLRKSTSESAFRWIIPCIYVWDLQNNILQIHVELGLVNSKAYVFKFANFSSFYVLIGCRIWSIKTANTPSFRPHNYSYFDWPQLLHPIQSHVSHAGTGKKSSGKLRWV
jgi:hypothetical protein